MRTSNSFTSFFASLRNRPSANILPSASTQFNGSSRFSSVKSLSSLSHLSPKASSKCKASQLGSIPRICIITPQEPIYSHPSVDRIQRWRSFLVDDSLRLPSKGLTSCARRTLARQGYATGSFRLNCSESAFAIRQYDSDSSQSRQEGILLVDVGPDDLEGDYKMGMEEQSLLEHLLPTSFARPDEGGLETTGSYDGDSPKKRKSDQMNIKACLNKSSSMQFSSSGLSSCATFTFGLSSFGDYIQEQECITSIGTSRGEDSDLDEQSSETSESCTLIHDDDNESLTLSSQNTRVALDTVSELEESKLISSSSSWFKSLRRSISATKLGFRKSNSFGRTKTEVCKRPQRHMKSLSDSFTKSLDESHQIRFDTQ